MVSEKNLNEVAIPDVEVVTLGTWVIGDSPLLSHAFSERAIDEMLSKRMKIDLKTVRKPTNPEEEFKSSLYYTHKGECGIPAVAFKEAMVGACRLVDGLSMQKARSLFFVLGDILKIYGSAPRMRRDIVRLNGKSADVRFRGEYTKWAVKLAIKSHAGGLSTTQLLGLLQLAGYTCGVGDWRPEKGGSMGMFHVGSDQEVRYLGIDI